MVKPNLERETYNFPKGKIRIVNWREVEATDSATEGEWPGMGGRIEGRTIIDRDSHSSKYILMGRSVFYPGAYHLCHLHSNSEEYVYVVSGKAVTGAGDKEFVITPGDVVFNPVREIHWLYNPFDEPLVILWHYCGVATVEDSGLVSNQDLSNSMQVIEKSAYWAKIQK
jgi:quercetin dioxygenase-like cupin family protein